MRIDLGSVVGGDGVEEAGHEGAAGDGQEGGC